MIGFAKKLGPTPGQRAVLVLVLAVLFSAQAIAHGGHGGSAQLQKHNNDRSIAAQVYLCL